MKDYDKKDLTWSKVAEEVNKYTGGDYSGQYISEVAKGVRKNTLVSEALDEILG